jgi:hypothetical protein
MIPGTRICGISRDIAEQFVSHKNAQYFLRSDVCPERGD